MYIKPRIVLIDETEYWNPDIVRKAGKIHGVYIYDENMRVHCCEFTPSYFLEPLYAITEHEVTVEVYDDILEGFADTNAGCMHCSDVEKLEIIKQPTERCKADEYSDWWETIVDYHIGNHIV